ncbi:RodZ domain-containing protein [Pseudomonas sp. Q1-7]|uniref:RodZ domain-containing protein n=1 Tax=Pseudomonas sp. Q1-7 TaxID=3020843 RepID=UPI0023002D5A|nr:RodZ family helix-turn-helix domain-containing protein [Pseudomonas sp. Q1-7]
MMKASHPEAVAAARANPGETLRQARENKNLTLGEVARHLNLTEQALRQLEAGDFEQLPGHTFARGYVRAYAKLLDMDQGALVAEFDHYTGTDAKGSNVHSLGRIEEPVRLSQSVLRIVSFVILVALGAVGFFWWQEHSSRNEEASSVNIEHVEVESADGTTQIHPLDEPEDQAVAEAEDGQAPVPAQVSPEVAAQPEQQPAEVAPAAPAGEAAPVAPDAPDQAPAVAAAPTVPNATTEQSSAPTATAAAPAASPAPAAEAPAPVVAQQGQGVVRIQFTANCWTQVTDADGKVLVSALKRTGESIELAGKAPLEVRLGFARGAQLSYNGQSIDVSPYVRGETARLKLGQ